jgi:hypothetical protein
METIIRDRTYSFMVVVFLASCLTHLAPIATELFRDVQQWQAEGQAAIPYIQHTVVEIHYVIPAYDVIHASTVVHVEASTITLQPTTITEAKTKTGLINTNPSTNTDLSTSPEVSSVTEAIAFSSHS